MQELYKNYIAWIEGKIEDYNDIFKIKDEWLRETHELIRQHKLPQPYLDDDYLDIDDLFEADFTPTEALQKLINCGEI